MSSGAEVVRRIRNVAAISQGELARRSGIAQSAISDYERGVKVPSIPTLTRLAESADVTLTIEVSPRPTGIVDHMRRLHHHRRRIHELCASHGASNPRIVGSVARGTATADSDIDLVVDIEPGRTLLDIAALHDDLVDLLAVEIDVITSGAVHGALADLLADAIPL
jgi:hypothetical protein